MDVRPHGPERIPTSRDGAGPWYTVCRFLAQWVYSGLFGIRVYGRRNVPRRGPVILASNHQSFLDPVAVGLGLPRPIHIMARASLFRNALFRLLIESLNAFPVARGSADLGAIHEAIERLIDGRQLLLFPEATRTRTGDIGRLNPGVALMAHRAGAAVVPVTIDGAFECWPRDRKLFRTGKIRVMFGKPRRVESIARADLARFLDDLRSTLVAQQEALRRMR